MANTIQLPNHIPAPKFGFGDRVCLFLEWADRIDQSDEPALVVGTVTGLVWEGSWVYLLHHDAFSARYTEVMRCDYPGSAEESELQPFILPRQDLAVA